MFELWKGQLVHWHICQLHANELNLREVYVKRGGTTTGPKSFSGPIGKMVAGAVETAPVVDFTPVPGDVKAADSDVLLQPTLIGFAVPAGGRSAVWPRSSECGK